MTNKQSVDSFISEAREHNKIPKIRQLLRSYDSQIEKKAPVNKIIKKLRHEMGMIKNRVDIILINKTK